MINFINIKKIINFINIKKIINYKFFIILIIIEKIIFIKRFLRN